MSAFDSISSKGSKDNLKIDKNTIQTLFNKAPFGVVFVSKSNKILFLNAEFKKITGYILKDIPTTGDWYKKAYPDPKYRKMVIETWRDEISAKGTNRILKVVCKNGETKEVEFRPTELEDGNYLMTITDHTEYKKAEEALEKREELYRSAIEIAGAVPYYRNYADDKYDFVGDGILELTGYGVNEFTPEVWNSIISDVVLKGPFSGLTLKEAEKLIFAGDELTWQAEYRIITRLSEKKWVANSSVEIKNSSGKVIGSVGILQDITEQKR